MGGGGKRVQPESPEKRYEGLRAPWVSWQL